MRKCRNWQTSKTKDLVTVYVVWVQVPSSALDTKKASGIKPEAFFVYPLGRVPLTQWVSLKGLGTSFACSVASPYLPRGYALGSKIPRQVLCSKSHLVNSVAVPSSLVGSHS